jgi:hypothetical protein
MERVTKSSQIYVFFLMNTDKLVSRCFVAWESKTPLKFTEKQQLSRLQTEYDTRLKEANIDDPRSFKDEAWSSDVKNWPKVDPGQIQLHHETAISCLLFKAIQTSCASFLILCEGDMRDVTTFVPFRDVK